MIMKQLSPHIMKIKRHSLRRSFNATVPSQILDLSHRFARFGYEDIEQDELSAHAPAPVGRPLETFTLWRPPLTRKPLATFLAPFVLVLVVGLGASACGGAPVEQAEAPSPLPLVNSTTTSVPALEITAEMLESMLATEEGRALLVSGVGSEVGLSPEEADCLVDGVPVEVLVAAASAFMGGGEADGPFSDEQLQEIAPVLEVCEISVESLSR